MKETIGDLFTQQCDAICITTNGITKKDGSAVMGAGVAKEAARRFKWLPISLGSGLKIFGNVTLELSQNKMPVIMINEFPAGRYACILDSGTTLPYDILSLPTKNDWRDNSDLNLIENSIKQLVQITNQRSWHRVCLTRPGCGNGGLDWKTVKERIQPLLDDRFCIVRPT